jgi:hypothetical protein
LVSDSTNGIAFSMTGTFARFPSSPYKGAAFNPERTPMPESSGAAISATLLPRDRASSIMASRLPTISLVGVRRRRSLPPSSMMTSAGAC